MPLITHNIRAGAKHQNIQLFTAPDLIDFIIEYTEECEPLAHQYRESLTIGTNRSWTRFDAPPKHMLIIYKEEVKNEIQCVINS